MKFGVAGIPVGCKRCNSEQGIRYVKSLGLDSMELEFVHGVKMSEEMASSIGRIAEDLGVTISSHAPYYINLLSRDKEVVTNSEEHIIRALKITDRAGGYVTAIHTGYMIDILGEEENYRIVKERYSKIEEFREQNSIRCKLGPESRGKRKGFGSLSQLIKLYEDLDVLPVFDIAHMHATGEFDFTKPSEFYRFFKSVDRIEKLHIHFSEIDYNHNGERRHLDLGERYQPDYRMFIDISRELGLGINVILETPDLERSALLMKEYYLKTV
ncbi:MAG: TIM barrel protein [Candidatus Anstonellales archaeon]